MFLVLKCKYPSLSSPGYSVWILVSLGHERFLNEIHRHNSDIVNYSSSLRAKEDNLDDVCLESSKPSVVNHGQGSSADKLSLDLKFNPWDRAITFRPEWRSTSKTVFAQYDPFETWYTCQSDVWLDDVKTFYPRPLHCVIVVHPYPLGQEDTTLLTEFAHLSNAKTCVHNSRVSPDLHKDKRVTLNKRQKKEISNSAAFITETNQVMWSLQTNTIPLGRAIMYMVTPATEASMMAVGHFAKIFDPGKNGLQLTDDSVTRLKNEFATNDPKVIFLIHSISGRQHGEIRRNVFTRNVFVPKRERERQGLDHC